jgi:hypothetical protein
MVMKTPSPLLDIGVVSEMHRISPLRFVSIAKGRPFLYGSL